MPGVRILQILGHQLQAVLAAGHLVWVIGVGGVGRLVAAQRPITVCQWRRDIGPLDSGRKFLIIDRRDRVPLTRGPRSGRRCVQCPFP